MQASLENLESESLPAEISNSVKVIFDHYKKYMDQQDVDSKTLERMAMLNKSSGIRLNSTFLIE